LDHPNILKVCGLSTSNQFGGDDGIFLILERLPCILTKRLHMWMQKDRASKGITGFVTRGFRQRDELMIERLMVAKAIGNAMKYLHSRKVIFRDVSPP